jgi:DNA-binding response OmpR family regulator
MQVEIRHKTKPRIHGLFIAHLRNRNTVCVQATGGPTGPSRRFSNDSDPEMPHTVLIVDSNPAALTSTARVLREAGYHVTTAASFENAKWQLRAVPPDLLVADVRLGDYNGIHLVIRGRTTDADLPAIVTDSTADRVLEADAQTQGAVYLVKPFDTARLVGVARELVARRPPRASTELPRRWPRTVLEQGSPARLRGLDGADRWQASIVDVGYGGLRLQLDDVTDECMSARALEFSAADLAVPVRPVWARRPSEGGPWWCGVEVTVRPSASWAWRRMVDKLRRTRQAAPSTRPRS